MLQNVSNFFLIASQEKRVRVSGGQDAVTTRLVMSCMSTDGRRATSIDWNSVDLKSLELRRHRPRDAFNKQKDTRAWERVKHLNRTENHQTPSSHRQELFVYQQKTYKTNHGHHKTTSDARQLLQTATSKTIAD
jgi:hypothetical protein